jgi:phosphoribosylformylglycinamidine (FGAM) synthase-like enzyme
VVPHQGKTFGINICKWLYFCSLVQGENKEQLDFNAVQRGDAEMEQKLNRVIKAIHTSSVTNN